MMDQMSIVFGEDKDRCCPTCGGTGSVRKIRDSEYREVTARNDDPETSHAARRDSEDVRRYGIDSDCARMLRAFAVCPDTQQGAALRVFENQPTPLSSVDGLRRRASSLNRANHIEDSGLRSMNEGSNRPSIVWQITEEGLRALRRLEITGWSA